MKSAGTFWRFLQGSLLIMLGACGSSDTQTSSRTSPVSPTAGPAVPPTFAVLVFSKTEGFRHDSIPAGITAIQALGRQLGFSVDATENAESFADAALSKYKAVVFLSTTGDVLNDTQQAAFERYIRAGGGFVG